LVLGALVGSNLVGAVDIVDLVAGVLAGLAEELC